MDIVCEMKWLVNKKFGTAEKKIKPIVLPC